MPGGCWTAGVAVYNRTAVPWARPFGRSSPARLEVINYSASPAGLPEPRDGQRRRSACGVHEVYLGMP